jgi:hypothetical protein
MPRPSATIPNPAFFADPDVREEVADFFTGLGAIGSERIPTLWSALPEEHGYGIPEEGAWIMVKEPPHTEIPAPPLYSIWRARRTFRSYQVRIGRRKVNWPLLRAVITTPHGELTLIPGEYQPVADLRRWLELVGEKDQGEEAVTIHFLGPGEPGGLAEQVFYIQTRGITRADALLLMLPDVEDADFAYLTVWPNHEHPTDVEGSDG